MTYRSTNCKFLWNARENCKQIDYLSNAGHGSIFQYAEEEFSTELLHFSRVNYIKHKNSDGYEVHPVK